MRRLPGHCLTRSSRRSRVPAPKSGLSLARGQQGYDVYLLNDRGGIYALGFPVIAPLDHLVNLAEVTVLALLVFVLLLAVNTIFKWLSRRQLRRRGSAA